MMLVSDRTRLGCSTATVWAIMPPIEMPATCADSRPRWSIRATASPARSDIEYGAFTLRPPKARTSWLRLTRARIRRGATGVAVVVADDVEALGREQHAELVVPPRHRAAEAHDEQERLAAGIAERLVAELDLVADGRDQLVGDDGCLGGVATRGGHASSEHDECPPEERKVRDVPLSTGGLG